MSKTSNSSSLHAFADVGIQERIFSIATRTDNARCARVCRSWKEIALDHVWEDMSSLLPLFELLAPLESFPIQNVRIKKAFRYSRELKYEDWETFTTYSKRVKCLNLSGGVVIPGQKVEVIDDSVFAEIARSRTALYILPNLSTLKLCPFDVCKLGKLEEFLWMKYSVLFMHRFLRVLEVDIKFSGWSSMNQAWVHSGVLFDEICGRSSCLKSLSLSDIGTLGTDFSVKLSSLFSKLTQLESVTIDPYALTQSILESLSALPNLRKIQISDYYWVVRRQEVGLNKEFQQIYSKNAFPRLRSLAIGGSFSGLATLFTEYSTAIFPNLVELDIYDEARSQPPDLLLLLSILSNDFPRLRRLTLRNGYFTINSRTENFVSSDDSPLTVAACVYSYMSCFPDMETFKYELAPCELTDNELVDTFGRCSSLRTLVLRPPILSSNPTPPLTLAVLPMLARACPLLCNLGLYINVTIGIPYDSDSFSDHRFSRLDSLDVGASPIDNPKVVSQYLSRILPAQCTLSYDDDGTECSGKWREVEELLPLFIQSYEGNLRAMRAVESELEATRNKLLSLQQLVVERDEAILHLQTEIRNNVLDSSVAFIEEDQGDLQARGQPLSIAQHIEVSRSLQQTYQKEEDDSDVDLSVESAAFIFSGVPGSSRASVGDASDDIEHIASPLHGVQSEFGDDDSAGMLSEVSDRVKRPLWESCSVHRNVDESNWTTIKDDDVIEQGPGVRDMTMAVGRWRLECLTVSSDDMDDKAVGG